MRLEAYPAIVDEDLMFLFIMLLRIGPIHRAAGDNWTYAYIPTPSTVQGSEWYSVVGGTVITSHAQRPTLLFQ